MLPFRLVYSDGYTLPLGEHVFPAEKYRLIRRRLLDSGVAEESDFVEPAAATDEQILRVHAPEYVAKLKKGTLSPGEERQLEVPYSPQLVQAFWMAAGGSILAARLALESGTAVNVGGGFHHAFADHGEGFCVIHDVAVAIKAMHAETRNECAMTRAMTIDLDLHHGNGTAGIFKTGQPGQPGLHALEVFTVSLHQANNYPFFKPPSSIDVALPDGTGDDAYLEHLEVALAQAFNHFTPQLICYIAGADPYRDDQLGGLALTIEGLRRRDEMVFAAARRRGIPVMVTFAGGYARQIADTVTIHCNTIRAAAGG